MIARCAAAKRWPRQCCVVFLALHGYFLLSVPPAKLQLSEVVVRCIEDHSRLVADMCQVEITFMVPIVKNMSHIFHKTKKGHGFASLFCKEVPGGEGLRELRKFLASTCIQWIQWTSAVDVLFFLESLRSIEIHDGCWRFRTTTEGR